MMNEKTSIAQSFPPVPDKDSTSPLPAFTEEDSKILFSGFREPPSSCIPLRAPLCIPQVTSGGNSTFVRAYSGELRASGVEMDDLLHFMDALNIAITASPPLRIVDVAGLIIGFVPYHWAIIAGAAMQTAAQTSIAIIAKTLTDRLLRRANEEYFAPRGLRVRICTNKAMRQLVGIDAPHEESKMQKFTSSAGTKAEGLALMLPIVRKVYNRIAPPVPSVDSNALVAAGMSPTDPTHAITLRRLLPLRGYIMPLDFNVPPAPSPDKLMDKASDMSMKLSLWFTKRQDSKVDFQRQLLAVQRGESDRVCTPGMSSSSSSSNPLEWYLGNRQRWKQDKHERMAIRRADKGRGPRKNLQTQVEIADRKEHNKTKQLLWVVIVNSDQDTSIQGKESVDNHDNYEHIPAEVWRQELNREKEEYKAHLQRGYDSEESTEDD